MSIDLSLVPEEINQNPLALITFPFTILITTEMQPGHRHKNKGVEPSLPKASRQLKDLCQILQMKYQKAKHPR